MSPSENDQLIKELLQVGRLRVDLNSGFVYAPMSNTPSKPIGASTKKGYLRTCINYDGKQVYLMVHRIVWVAAHGVPRDSSWHVDHGNGVKSDNRPCNLELVPGFENTRRATVAGFYRNNGERNKVDAFRDGKGRFVGRPEAVPAWRM